MRNLRCLLLLYVLCYTPLRLAALPDVVFPPAHVETVTGAVAHEADGEWSPTPSEGGTIRRRVLPSSIIFYAFPRLPGVVPNLGHGWVRLLGANLYRRQWHFAYLCEARGPP